MQTKWSLYPSDSERSSTTSGEAPSTTGGHMLISLGMILDCASSSGSGPDQARKYMPSRSMRWTMQRSAPKMPRTSSTSSCKTPSAS
ncbi:hypothetical protein GBA65_20705 [Rubrobacter marinus]|uniref:Uncharacterized protein n=1 Tax=Rubrobacter marinus TaxID=2653852 RepID=A0A6G8Q246_9ACTN|nr:hypothetical protein [Rubrobacter marinus]QIN80528.1 hypothetical protein GBA65_20705 [Rubrobacter marinus]